MIFVRKLDKLALKCFEIFLKTHRIKEEKQFEFTRVFCH